LTAIITDRFRFDNLSGIFNRVTLGQDLYYLGIGRSEPWENDLQPPQPTVAPQDSLRVRHGLQSIKRIVDVTPCAPRYNWKAGETFVAYDDADADLHTKQYYVINQNNFNVYICLKAGAGSSTVEPLGVDDNGTGVQTDQGIAQPVLGADGYIWKYLYTISAVDAQKYLTNDFMPVFRNEFVAANATAGQIFDVVLTEQGAGYGSTPTISITGNGTGAAATATISGGVITNIAITNYGSGYTYAKVAISGGSPTTPAIANAVVSPTSLGREIEGVEVVSGGSSYTNGSLALDINGDGTGATATATVVGGSIQNSVVIDTPGYGYTEAKAIPTFSTAGTEAELNVQYTTAKGGFGYNPLLELNAYFLMFNIVLEGDENPVDGFNGDFIPANNYRQLTIIKNPLKGSPASGFTETTGIALESHTVQPSGTWVLDDVITGASSGAKAIIDYYDANTETLYYHQNDDTGFVDFSDGEALTGTGVSAGTIATSNTPGEFDKYSGTVLYLENRVAVSRAPDQTEDIKLVIQV